MTTKIAPDHRLDDVESPAVHLLHFVERTATTRLEVTDAVLPLHPRIVAARRLLRMAPAFRDDMDSDEGTAFRDTVAELTSELAACVTLPLSTFSLVINWSDGDADQGTFGTTVRAWGRHHAELLARAEMEASDSGSDFTGSVVDCTEGATWEAPAMEKLLRKVHEAFDPSSTSTLRREIGELLARIDSK